MSNTVADFLTNDDRFKTLVRLVNLCPEIVEIVKGNAPFTIFAPQDDAFKGLPSGWNEKFVNDTDLLLEVLRLHIVPKLLSSAEVADHAKNSTTEKARDNSDLKFLKDDGHFVVNVDGINAKIVEPDIKTDNGVIHVIDKMLLLVPIE